MAQRLSSFKITRSGDEYLLELEDEDGARNEVLATFEQLDLLAEALDEQLNSDEEDALSAAPDEED